MPRNQPSRCTIQCYWEDPPLGFYKLNFDGASKCNLVDSSFEGIIRDHIRETKNLFYGKIVHETNNASELEGLIHGLGITQLHN